VFVQVVCLTWCCESKMTKHHGLDVVELQEDLFPELDRCLSLYLADYRVLLLREEIAHAFVFVNAKGEAFKSSAFSEYLGRLLTRLTGRKATSNVLRSSFVTSLMETNPSDSEKTSAQSLLRHSERKQAECTIGKVRDPFPFVIILTAVAAAPAQKKVAVQRLSSTAAAKRLRESDSHVEAEVPRARFKSPTFALGQDMLVVVPFVDSGYLGRFASDGHSNHPSRNWRCVVLVCQNSSCDSG
jgi:hypothetical protein